jgi:hypothetical protein
MPSVVKRKPSKPISPDNPKSSETEPAQQVQNQKDLDSYDALAKELGQSVSTIHELYRQLEQLISTEQPLLRSQASLRLKLNTVEDPAILKDDLAKVSSELSFAHTRISAKQEQITNAENQLHDLLPKARETAQRLYLAYQNHTYAHACARIRDLIHHTAQEQVSEQINELALHSVDVVEAKLLSPPNIPFLVQEALEPKDGLFRPFPADRKTKMEYVTQLADSLSDQMIQILDRAQDLEDFHPPVFFLGPEPEPPQVELSWQSIPIRYSQDDSLVDQEFVWQGKDSNLTPHMEAVLKEAGKTKEDLTLAYYEILKHSEKLQRQSAKGGGMLFQPNPVAQH